MENKVVRKISGKKHSDKAIEELTEEIRREEVPERILELAHQLQTALDARKGDRN